MITATATGDDGKRVIVLGISRENVNRLIEGKPIRVGAVTHPGFPEDMHIVIFFGETERTLVEEFKELINDDTKIVTVPRKGGQPS